MPPQPLATPARPAVPDALLHHARQALQSGAPADDLLPPALGHVSRSWRRSMAAGLNAFAPRVGTAPLTRLEVARATERQHELLAHARPVMQYLMGQTREHAGMVILADADGLLLHALGDAPFLQRAERVALAPGASWHEHHRGTNAIGTALAEAAPVMVHGAEHFLECNGFLTCAAAPVTAPDGQVLGVLDFSSERQRHHPRIFDLVRAASQMIENRLFAARHGRQLRLHLHPLPEGLGTLAEGVLAVAEDGLVTGANTAALALLNLPARQIGRVRLHELLDTCVEALLRHAHGHGGHALLKARPLAARAAPLLHLRVQPATVPAPQLPAVPAVPAADALHALDTGDAAWRATLHKARKLLPQPIALLLHGESGTGKEVLARALHDSGPRRARAFVAVNCAALPEHLIEAELFGHAPGAFTGARREGAPGLIRQADGGTLLLDEIGDMPLALQTRLLRVLQERRVTPLGGGQPVAVDFALICATHRDLRAEVAAGRFRADLYWRLNGLTLHLPPLRQRSDFDALAQRMLQNHAGARPLALAPGLACALRRHDWPGNLRQLDSALRTAIALLDEGETLIDWQHLPDDLCQALARPGNGDDATSGTNGMSNTSGTHAAPLAATPPRRLAQHTEQAMHRALAQAGGNISQAARDLGIGRSTLYRWLRRARTGGGTPQPFQDLP
ncbi:sigma-54-dependent Fis family transcriptional regulator [Comamonadaceae bacterium OH2545_COT-014]|nr:sigma-54-dependent Fis family transcriptional regulator [Comamonadaceae bacterium OH2545_COT-014]